MVKYTIEAMPEALVVQDQGGFNIKLTNSARTGYRVYIERPDGTVEYQVVASPSEGRTVMGDIKDGEFQKYCMQHLVLYPWEGECPRDKDKKAKRRR